MYNVRSNSFGLGMVEYWIVAAADGGRRHGFVFVVVDSLFQHYHRMNEELVNEHRMNTEWRPSLLVTPLGQTLKTRSRDLEVFCPVHLYLLILY